MITNLDNVCSRLRYLRSYPKCRIHGDRYRSPAEKQAMAAAFDYALGIVVAELAYADQRPALLYGPQADQAGQTWPDSIGT